MKLETDYLKFKEVFDPYAKCEPSMKMKSLSKIFQYSKLKDFISNDIMSQVSGKVNEILR